jgi:hypothetical protein
MGARLDEHVAVTLVLCGDTDVFGIEPEEIAFGPVSRDEGEEGDVGKRAGVSESSAKLDEFRVREQADADTDIGYRGRASFMVSPSDSSVALTCRVGLLSVVQVAGLPLYCGTLRGRLHGDGGGGEGEIQHHVVFRRGTRGVVTDRGDGHRAPD